MALAAARRLGLLRRRPPPPPAVEARLSGRLHSRARDSEAISHHYDISNEMYRAMLGPTMVYSCAYYAAGHDTLDAAQTRKLDLICRKLELGPLDRLLDIGCGWGSLLIHAAREYGARGVGVTISERQAELARERVRESGPRRPHRDPPPGLPRRRRRALRQDRQHRHVRARRPRQPRALLRRRARAAAPRTACSSTTASCARAPQPPSAAQLLAPLRLPRRRAAHAGRRRSRRSRTRGFELRDDESLRPHYARTLRDWGANLDAWREQAIAEIGAERERVWRLHNAGAALAFERGTLSVHQVIAAPLNVGAAPRGCACARTRSELRRRLVRGVLRRERAPGHACARRDWRSRGSASPRRPSRRRRRCRRCGRRSPGACGRR